MLPVCLPRAFEPNILNMPVVIVSVDKVCNRRPKLFNTPVVVAIYHLLFERSIEPLCYSVGLRFGHEGKTWRDSPYLGSSSYHTFSHMKIHGFGCGIYVSIYGDYVTAEYIDMYDIRVNSGSDHPKLFYIKNTNKGTIRYAKYYNSAASGTGIAFSDGGPFADWQVYGNLFYDMTQNYAAAIGITTGGAFGGTGVITGLKIYNNTFSNNYLNINMYRSCGTRCETLRDF